MATKYVLKFSEGSRFMKDLLGGKGANLAEMTVAGLPVPPGFTVTTEACMEYIRLGRQFPAGLADEIRQHMQDLEMQTGKTFGGGDTPLLVSVRSGSKFSMPGMMDTVLNLGLNEDSLKTLIATTGDERFALDAYRRLITMFGSVVQGIEREKFDGILDAAKKAEGVTEDPELSPAGLRKACNEMLKLAEKETGEPFPADPYDQLYAATRAVFDSWDGERAYRYRVIHKIPHDLGTAVNVQTMVFGNMGESSGTGVAFTRDPATGEKKLYADYLVNAQGEDVVGGERNTMSIDVFAEQLPEAHEQLSDICNWLELRYGDMQDLEFTIEDGMLWMLQTRNGKRTGPSALKIAVDMVDEGLITTRQAVMQVEAQGLDQLLHRQFDPKQKPQPVAGGVDASPGAAAGRVVFSAEDARKAVLSAKTHDERRVILVRHKTEPDDVGGMEVAQGILTAIGGKTSHAAVVARQMGKPCVSGCAAMDIDYENEQFEVNGHVVKAGDFVSIDGTLGQVMLGDVPTADSEVLAGLLGDQTAQSDTVRYFQRFMGWVDAARRLGVRANADTPDDAARARALGAQGIGLCRTEHMFFDHEEGEGRTRAFQRMILAETDEEQQAALDELVPFQRADFEGILEAMDGLPVIIRLLDPPLHEFLPPAQPEEGQEEEWRSNMAELCTLTGKSIDDIKGRIRALHEMNPMLGHRGCRLAVTSPAICRMQARAIFEAACNLKKRGLSPLAEVMIPVAGMAAEVEMLRKVVDEVAEEVMNQAGIRVEYMVGTMIELPRACLTADEIAKHAQFFSYGTNDLTQTTFGFSRDDVEGKFMEQYITQGILGANPFDTIDRPGVGEMVRIGTEKGRAANPDLEVGICGEHGGEPASVEFCHEVGMDYVSCSPLRVPVARVAAAQAAIKEQGTGH